LLGAAALPDIGRLFPNTEPANRGRDSAEMLATAAKKVAEAGYQGFEFGNWRAQDAAAITKLKSSLGLECACLVGNRAVNPKGMTLVDPADRAAFLAEIQASTEAAQRFVQACGKLTPHA